MPLQGWAHKFYWENSDTVVTPIAVAPLVRQYPAWQASVTIGTMFGGLVPFFERLWDSLCWWSRTHPRIMRLGREDRAVLLTALNALEHPAYPLAQAAVRKTATTLGFNRPEAWTQLSRELKASAGQSENAYRHLEACRLTRANLLNSTLTNPECNLLVELAYHGYAARVK